MPVATLTPIATSTRSPEKVENVPMTDRTLLVETLLHGPLAAPEDMIVRFVSPILGFDDLSRFVIYQKQPGPLSWMQSVERKDVVFCLLAPFQAGLDFDIELLPQDLIELDAKELSAIDVFTIVVLDKDPAKARTNLRGPILVCRASGKAKQIVLDNAALPHHFALADIAGWKTP